MEQDTITLIFSIIAIALAVVAIFKKSKTVVEYRSDLTLKTENRIREMENKQNLIVNVLDKYELKTKKK